MSAKVKIDVEKLKQLFDLVVHSMDFGSGFLDQEDIELLRDIAGVIGVDPMVATPSELTKQYPHQFREPPGNPNVSASTGQPVQRGCYWCGRKPGEHPHVTPSSGEAGTNPDETWLPASTGGGIPRAETQDGNSE